MKKIITSASLAVLGAASLQAATPLDRSYYAPNPELTPQERTKWWSIQASLRGFYDDNYLTLPKNLKKDSYGFEVSPSVGINIPLEQTYLGLNYTYSMRRYEDRHPRKDHTHQATLLMSHSFTETTKLTIKDSFVYSRDPQLLEPGVVTAPRINRSDLNSLRNHADATAEVGLSRQFSTSFGYENTLYNYEEKGAGSYSALLDR